MKPGDELPVLAIPMTATRIVAGALATRDFMPVHHDRDFANKQGEFTIAIPQLNNAQITILFVGTALYEKVPSSLGSSFTNGKPWIKIDLSQFGKFASLNPTNLGASDPTQALNYLLGASSNVQDLGHETVRGDDTTHYKLDLDLTTPPARLPGW